MRDKSPSQQIDDIILEYGGWKGEVLKHLREVITKADPKITEEVKWKMPTRPAGLPVWSYQGIVCFAEIWKDNIKLIFFKGAELSDPDKLFNCRLNSSTVRAIEIREGEPINKTGITTLVVESLYLNERKSSRPTK